MGIARWGRQAFIHDYWPGDRVQCEVDEGIPELAYIYIIYIIRPCGCVHSSSREGKPIDAAAFPVSAIPD